MTAAACEAESFYRRLSEFGDKESSVALFEMDGTTPDHLKKLIRRAFINEALISAAFSKDNGQLRCWVVFRTHADQTTSITEYATYGDLTMAVERMPV